MTTWSEITTAVGLALTGDAVAGRRDLLACWAGTRAQDRAQRCVLAHYLADLEPDLVDEVAWDERALAAFAEVASDDLVAIGIPDAAVMAPSLHLNLADGYLRQGRVDDADTHLRAGLAAQHSLAADGYGALVRRGLADLHERLASARRSEGAHAPQAK